jgi:hypothetical protein
LIRFYALLVSIAIAQADMATSPARAQESPSEAATRSLTECYARCIELPSIEAQARCTLDCDAEAERQSGDVVCCAQKKRLERLCRSPFPTTTGNCKAFCSSTQCTLAGAPSATACRDSCGMITGPTCAPLLATKECP